MNGSPGSEALPSLSYVVPTIGASEHLEGCLASIYRDAEDLDAPAELVIVWQSPAGPSAGTPAALRTLCRRLASARPGAFDDPPRIVELPRPAGFARAANDGMAISNGEWIALVNDDVVLEAGWARHTLTAAAAAPAVAAVQGINVMAADDGARKRIDGAGLAWNRRWQAIQLGRGEAAAAGPTGPPQPLYGVSATAAIYRRRALADVSSGSASLRPLEERLDSYYEDVELADRLHCAGYRALLAPAARAEHAGALSSRSRRAACHRTRRVYANRLLVVARRLGRGFWPRLPILLRQDLVDALRRTPTAAMPGDLEPPSAVDLLHAWCRAIRLLPRFARFGPGIPR